MVNIDDLPDHETRKYLHTRTSNGEWDQILALSQGIINQQFEALYNCYPEMSTMYTSIDDIGSLDAKLLAPRILIPNETSAGGGLNHVYFDIRFASGSLADRDSYFLVEDLTGWNIAIKVTISKRGSELPPGASYTEIELNKKQQKAAEEKFVHLEGWSVERLYLDLTTASTREFDQTHSMAGAQKFLEWANANESAHILLDGFLKTWLNKQHDTGRNLIGLNLSLPPNTTGITPTFATTDMIHQCYNYRSKADGCPNGEEGYDKYGSRNCLLYCECLEGHSRPQDYMVLHQGNYTTVPYTEGGVEKVIDGTLVISRNMFLDKFILPLIQPINRAIELNHGASKAWMSDKGQPGFSYGYNMCADSRYSDSKDPIYQFKRTETGSGGALDKRYAYRYEKINDWPATMTSQEGDDTSLACQVKCKDEMSVDITWEPGSTELLLRGRSYSNESILAQQGPERKQFKGPYWAYIRDTVEITWNARLRIETRTDNHGAGYLQVVLDTGDPGAPKIEKDDFPNIVVKVNKDEHNFTADYFPKEFHDQMKHGFEQIFPQIRQGIMADSACFGRFVFPGTGTFDFQDAFFSQGGDLVCQVNYKHLDPQMKITLPEKKEFNFKDAKPLPPVRQAPVITPEPKALLTWPTTPITVIAGDIGSVLIRGKNDTDKAVYFRGLYFDFEAIEKDLASFPNALFAVDEVLSPEAAASADQKETAAKAAAEEIKKVKEAKAAAAEEARKAKETKDAAAEEARKAKETKDAAATTAAEKYKDNASGSVNVKGPGTGAARDTAGLPVGSVGTLAPISTTDKPATAESVKSTTSGTSGTASKPGLLGAIAGALGLGKPAQEPAAEPASEPAAEPTPAESPPVPTKTHAVATLRESKPAKGVVTKIIHRNSKSSWRVEVKNPYQPNSGLEIAAGQWIELELRGHVPDSKKYLITVTEDYQQIMYHFSTKVYVEAT